MRNLNKGREATIIVKEDSTNLTQLTSTVVASAVLWNCCCLCIYSYRTHTNKKNTMIKQKVSTEKTELKYGDNTCRKIGIDESNCTMLNGRSCKLMM